MEQAGVSARACVPELLPVPSQGIKLDIPRRHRTAQRSPSSAAASRRRAVKRSSAAVSFCSDTRSTVKKPTLNPFEHRLRPPRGLLGERPRRRSRPRSPLACTSSAQPAAWQGHYPAPVLPPTARTAAWATGRLMSAACGKASSMSCARRRRSTLA